MKPFLLHYTAPHSVTCLSASHLSGFSRGGWKSLLSLGLHSLLNSLSLYLWQGQKQQKQPEKDCNLQETQCSASLGLIEFHGKHLPVTVCMSGKNAWEHWNILRFVTNLKNHTKKITPKKSHQISHIALCLQCICHGRVSVMLNLPCSVLTFNCWGTYQMI